LNKHNSKFKTLKSTNQESKKDLLYFVGVGFIRLETGLMN